MAVSLISRRQHILKLLSGLRAFSTMNSDKIYEMRTYTIKPEKFADYVKLFTENIGTRTAHSKLCGFWTTESGGTLSQLIHIWEYDSYSHRTAVREALSKDKKWNTEFTPFSKPMILKQENVIMRPATWYKVRDPVPTGGIYELRTYTYMPAKRSEIERLWAPIIPARSKYSSAIGIWFNEIGPINQVNSLWSYENADERARIRKAAFEDPEIKEAVLDVDVFFTDTKCQLLVPTVFSPWK